MINYSQNFYLPQLSGKVVESKDIVRISEIPQGGFGIFPLADFSCVYIKYWDKDNRTQIIEYVQEKKANSKTLDDIYELLSELILPKETQHE